MHFKKVVCKISAILFRFQCVDYIINIHDGVIKWKHFPRYWPFVRGIHRSPLNSPHKGQSRRALMFSLICVWINGWVNNHEAGDLRCYRTHYDVIVTFLSVLQVEVIRLDKGDDVSLGFSVVGLRSEHRGELGIFVQEIQPGGLAAR